MSTRSASHAGSWYSAKAPTLSAQLDQWLDQVPTHLGDVGDVDTHRLIMLDARAMRFETLRYRWDADNPLSGTTPTIKDLSVHK